MQTTLNKSKKLAYIEFKKYIDIKISIQYIISGDQLNLECDKFAYLVAQELASTFWSFSMKALLNATLILLPS